MPDWPRGERSGGLNPSGGEICHTLLDRPWSLSSPLYNGYRISFTGIKRLGCGINHPPQYTAEVKEEVELYMYSPSGPPQPVMQ
jgi:hypothetical protein